MEKQNITQPAVLIGGPPHAGKSVLTYSLTRALRQYGISHYVMRACPDGEGHWSQETPQQVTAILRRKGEFSDIYVERVCRDIEHRQLPFLVDVGGLPQGEQFQIFQRCTHAVLLRHRSPAAIDWPALVADYRLELLADYISELEGIPLLEERSPVLRGQITGLQRGSTVQGEPFESLVTRLIDLFAPATGSLSADHQAKAPTPLVLNLPQILSQLAPGTIDWIPAMVPHLLELTPSHAPISAYGRAPHWIYAALLLHASAPFYQFDVRLGWVKPLALRPGRSAHPEIGFEVEERADQSILHCHLHNQNLDYDQLDGLHVPSLPENKGIILDGKLPLWFFTSLAAFYQQFGPPWIASFHPPLQGAVVIFSRSARHAPGDLLPITFARRP